MSDLFDRSLMVVDAAADFGVLRDDEGRGLGKVVRDPTGIRFEVHDLNGELVGAVSVMPHGYWGHAAELRDAQEEFLGSATRSGLLGRRWSVTDHTGEVVALTDKIGARGGTAVVRDGSAAQIGSAQEPGATSLRPAQRTQYRISVDPTLPAGARRLLLHLPAAGYAVDRASWKLVPSAG